MEGCNNESQEFSCDICHKYFSRERQLKMHIKIHHESSTITCELCTNAHLFYGSTKAHKRKRTLL